MMYSILIIISIFFSFFLFLGGLKFRKAKDFFASVFKYMNLKNYSFSLLCSDYVSCSNHSCVCVCVCVCVCAFVITPNRGGDPFLTSESGRHTQPWSSTVFSGCSSMVRTMRIHVQYSPWGYTMDSPFSRMESREMFV